MPEDQPGVVVRPNGTIGTYTSNEVPAIHRREATLQNLLTPEIRNNLRYQLEQMASDHFAPHPERTGPEPPNPPTVRTHPVPSAPATYSSGPSPSENASSTNVEGRSSTACAARRPGGFPNQVYNPNQNYNPNQSLNYVGSGGPFTPGFISYPNNATPEQGYLPPGFRRASSTNPCTKCGGLNWRYSHQNACKVQM